MTTKYLPIVATGFTKHFFKLDLLESEFISCPHLEVDGNHNAQFVIELGDKGLSKMGVNKGDYLLFSKFQEVDYRETILLIRNEGEYIIRTSNFITPVNSVLSTPGDVYEPITLPSENIRIVATCSGIVKPHDEIKIMTFGQ